jgi:uncharacterized Zn finger protein (UPF0148 family)
MSETRNTGPGVPQLVCPGCGSPHVEHERGLLFCGTCGTTVAVEGADPDPALALTPEQERRRAFRASLRTGAGDDITRARRASDDEAWAGRPPSASYGEWLAEGGE